MTTITKSVKVNVFAQLLCCVEERVWERVSSRVFNQAEASVDWDVSNIVWNSNAALVSEAARQAIRNIERSKL